MGNCNAALFFNDYGTMSASVLLMPEEAPSVLPALFRIPRHSKLTTPNAALCELVGAYYLLYETQMVELQLSLPPLVRIGVDQEKLLLSLHQSLIPELQELWLLPTCQFYDPSRNGMDRTLRLMRTDSGDLVLHIQDMDETGVPIVVPWSDVLEDCATPPEFWENYVKRDLELLGLHAEQLKEAHLPPSSGSW